MNPEHSVYLQVADKYHLAGDDWFLKVLRVLMTPEEAQYLVNLAVPQTPAQLAQKLGTDEKTTAAGMDALARRGLLFRGRTQYIAWGDAHQLKARVMFSADENIPPEYLELRRTEERYVNSRFAEIHSWFKIYERMGRPLVRVIPARKAIASNPAIRPEDTLWYEDIAEMLKRAGKIGVVDCDCRRIYQRCGKPLWTCLHFGPMVDYELGRGGRMREISSDEAIEIADQAEEAGLVHNTPGNFAALSGVICNCCTDCCSTFEPALQAGRLNEVVGPSRFRATVNQEVCKGCRECLKRCPFGAIEMVRAPGSKLARADVLIEKCLGCGVCVVGCQHKAMTFELVRPPEFIPPKPSMGQPLTYSIY